MPGKYTLCAIVLLAALIASAVADEQNVIDTGAVTLVPMAEGIYAVEPNFAGAAGAVILNESGHIVVDSHGTPASAKALINAVSTISDQPIRYVINTHWHVDHHSGNEAYKAAYGDAVVFISHDETRSEIPTLGAGQRAQMAPYRTMPIEAAEAELASKQGSHGQALSDKQMAEITAFRDAQKEYANRDEYEFTLPNLTYREAITLHGRPNTVEVFYLYPAHTKSDSIIYLRDQEILIVGDLLTKPILWSWSSFPASYVKTLKELEGLPARKIVIGHGGPVLDGKAYLTLVREFLESIVEYTSQSVAAEVEEDVAIEAAASREDIQQFRRKFVTEEEDGMFDQMVGWTISRAYLELAE